MTKQEHANEIFRTRSYLGRGKVMETLMYELDVSRAHASTLYNNARKAVAAHVAGGNLLSQKVATKRNAALSKYIADENHWRTMFKKPDLEYPTNKDQCMPFFDALLGELSPENLTCDGELSRAQVAAKSNRLHAIWAALEEIAGRKVPESEVWTWYEQNRRNRR